MMLMSFTAYADDNTGSQRELNVYLDRDNTNCIFDITWENTSQKATVKLINPDDKVVSASFSYESGSATAVLPQAKEGYWKVVVIGKNLGAVSVTGGSKDSKSNSSTYETENSKNIKAFEVKPSGQKIETSWEISSKSKACNITLYAVNGDRTYQIWYDRNCNKKDSRIDLADSLSTGYYKFVLDVYDDDGEYTAVTPLMYFKTDNALPKLNNVKSGSIDGDYYISWDVDINSSNRYLITLYDYDTMNIIQTYETNQSPYKIDFDNSLSRIKYSVAATDYNNVGNFEVYDLVRSSPSGIVVFPKDDTTHNSFVSLQFECPDSVTGGVYLDEKLVSNDIKPGEYRLSFNEGEHEIIAFLQDENGNKTTFKKKISCDNTPPDIIIDCNEENETTADSFNITGSTEPNATLMINGVEYQLSSGTFSAKTKLNQGNNTVTITAYDAAGNQSVKTVNINRKSTIQNYIVYIIPVAVFVLLLIWYIKLNKKAKRRQQNETQN